MSEGTSKDVLAAIIGRALKGEGAREAGRTRLAKMREFVAARLNEGCDPDTVVDLTEAQFGEAFGIVLGGIHLHTTNPTDFDQLIGPVPGKPQS